MAFPETKELLEAAGWLFDNEGYCRSCKAKVEWWIRPNGGKIPMDVVEVKKDNGFFAPTVSYKRVTHFVSCPDRKEWRKK